jgi:glycosyltransferase involved in cell wall biosynthesis
MRRGFESFTVQCHEALQHDPRLDVRLFASGQIENARRVPSLHRHSPHARRLGRLLGGRSGYSAEQATFGIGLVPYLVAQRPHVVFVSDIALGRLLAGVRRFCRLHYRILLSNGGLDSPPYRGYDHVQQLAPGHLERAMAAGVPAERQTLLPYGIVPPRGDVVLPPAERDALRARLGLPRGRPILLSVAALERKQKRLDLLIDEVASLGPQRPFLVLLGHPEPNTPEILDLARRCLGPDGFVARSVPRDAVDDYLLAADAFVLSSLVEGLPRALLEAGARGLPCLVHESSATRFVLEDHGFYVDASRRGSLAAAIPSVLAASGELPARKRRADSVRSRFAWAKLTPAYVEMLQRVAAV